MQPDYQALPMIRRIAGKETTLFFTSPIAYLFLACFAAVTLFIFFWGEAFFARNIADVRPLFEWMPVLLIFLSSTLTMRLWSEERRSGTLEHVLTQPTPLWHFVLGKFAGCLILLGAALLVTLPLPVSVSLIGELDWGPVWAGYLATFLLGAAYLSIGLFVSSRSDNQIVSLISATALCGIFYLLGNSVITDFFGTQSAEWLRLLGSGSRFDAITRGVIDLRDLYYYLSIIAIFLTLNTYGLEKERWASSKTTPRQLSWRIVTALLIANALGANLWLGQLSGLRLDVTAGHQYSISAATQSYLSQLQEPLLLRGYFSSKTHPLLAPLVPQLQDLLREYAIASHGKVRVEFVDPLKEPELEQEANQKYGIQPAPFQVADRYQSAIVSSYFNVLVQYGDQYQVLGFRDLIEVQTGSETKLDVQLRNPEHDLTRAIKKVLNAYQSGGNPFDTLKGNLALNAYISADSTLPPQLVEFRKTVQKVAENLQAQSHGRFSVNFIDPDAGDGQVAKQIAKEYGMQPLSLSLTGGSKFYFYLTLVKDKQVGQIPLNDLTEAGFKHDLEAGVKRYASGFTKTVALVTPQADVGQLGRSAGQFQTLEKFIGAELNFISEDLSDGRVSGDADVLLLLAPNNLNDKQLFAVDQFLMQGGTVIAATSPYAARLTARSISLQQHHSGLADWLAHNGLKLEEKLVLDPQNSALPLPVNRNVGGFMLQEMRMLDYPYFIDIRGQGLHHEHPVIADLPQLTMTWASPIQIDPDKQGQRKISELLRSSDKSWLSASTDVMPHLDANGQNHYASEGQTGSQLLGVVSAGRFESYFAGKASPLLSQDKIYVEPANGANINADSVSGVIEHSPESARIILFASNDFLTDQVIRIAGSASRSEYLNSPQLIANTLDWALEDASLLSIRARGHFNRTLPPMEHDQQLFWEYGNYALAAAALGLIAWLQRARRGARHREFLRLLTE